MADQSEPTNDTIHADEDASAGEHSTHKPLAHNPQKKTSLYLALALFVVVIAGLILGVKMAADNSNATSDPATNTPVASEVPAEAEATSAPAEDNAQGLSSDTVEELAESSTDGDGLIDFIQYNPSDSTYTVVVRNVSGADETYAVSVLVDGEPVGAKGVEVPASSTATVTVDVALPRGTDEVTLRLDGEILGEGIVEVLHQN